MVGRIAGRREGDAVAGLERRGEGEQEGARRAHRRDDAPGIDVDPVRRRVVAGDGPAQRRGAERLGVAETLAAHGLRGRLDHARGRARARLPDLQMQHVGAARRALVGRLEHLHGVERRDPTPARDLERHRPPPGPAAARGDGATD